MRRITLNLSIALRSLYSFKLRTSLAVLGVLLGTLSLIVVSNLTGSLVKQGEKELEKLGKNLLLVQSGTVIRFGMRTRLISTADTLKIADVQAILDHSPHVSMAAPSSTRTFPIRYENIVLRNTVVTGTSSNFTHVRNFQVERGRFFTEEEDRQLERVVVLGSRVAQRLFGAQDPLGKHILIWRVPCQVIGVMEEKGVDISNVDQDDQVFIPMGTFLRRFVNQQHVANIYVQTMDSDSMMVAKSQIEAILRDRHNIQPGQQDDFTVIDSRDLLELKTQTTSMITLLGRIAATISFLIGAMGILSIMILIVNERKGEIGIRRAVGSRRRDIVLQFLLESSFIALMGGMVGVLLGLATSLIIFYFSGLPLSISPLALLVAFCSSVLVGILAGLYPSQKATTIQPINILNS